MADISISKSRGKKYLGGSSPMVPAFIVGDDPIPLNPPGTIPTTLYKLLGDVTDSSFVGKNGFVPVVVGENVLTLQSLTTNVLATPLTGYVVGANTAITASSTILTAFQQVQGQINARISGTIASGQVAFGTGVNTVGGSSGLTVSASTNTQLNVTGVTGQAQIILRDSTLLTTFDVLTNSAQSFITTSGSVNFRIQGSGVINFQTTNSNITRWSILNDGTLQSNGARIIGTTTGNLTLGTYGGNGNILLTPNGTGLVMIGSGTPTNLLDVNGTARIRTIANGVGDFLTKSATGVLQQRTAAETRGDIGAQATIAGTLTDGYVATVVAGVPTWAAPSGGGSNWLISTPTNNYIYRTQGKFFVGVTNAIAEGSGNNSIILRGHLQEASSGDTIQIQNSDGDILQAVNHQGFARFPFTGSFAIGRNTTPNYFTFVHRANANGNGGIQFLVEDSLGVSNFQVDNIGRSSFRGRLTLNDGATINTSNLIFQDGRNIQVNTTTGTKIGTATTQKIAFWNKTPIIQPTTAYASSVLSSLGGTTITDTDTFDGYTLKQIVAALRGIGLLA